METRDQTSPVLPGSRGFQCQVRRKRQCWTFHSVIIATLEAAVDEKGAHYRGVKLDWDYEKRTLDISMPKYVHKILQHFQHDIPARQQDSPYYSPPLKYDAAAHGPLPEDTSDIINKKRVKII